MKAIRIHSYGAADQLKEENVPQPAPNANQVLVKIHDAGVNPVDWKIRAGYLKDSRPSKFPLTMGQDFAGEIVEVGAGVTEFSKGDRVCGFANGSYAELAIASESKIAKIPESVSYEVAASVPTAGLTAYQLVMKVAKPFPEQTILIHGAGGGVGSIATQIAVHHGVHVFGTASKRDIPYLEQLNITRAIDYQTQEFDKLLQEMDVVIDLVGGETQKRSFSVLKREGLLATTVGLVDPTLPRTLGIQAIAFYMEPNATDLEALMKMVESGVVVPRVAQVIPLDEARTAQELSETGKPHGKIVLKVA